MKLYFGCGKHRVPGFIGIDKIELQGVDVVHDMTLFPYPFRDSSVRAVLLINIHEHLPDTIRVIEEIWRICEHGSTISIQVPYYNSPGAYQDPTHVRFFTENSFDYFTEDGATDLSEYNYYSHARFRIVTIIPHHRTMLNVLPRRIQWFLAHHLSTVHSIEFSLEVLKS